MDPSQVLALKANIVEAGSVRTGAWAALAVAAKAHNKMEVYRMLAHPSEDRMRKTVKAMGIAMTGHWRSCKACLQTEAKQHAVPKMTDERASVKE